MDKIAAGNKDSMHVRFIRTARWGYVLLGGFWCVLGVIRFANFVSAGGTLSGSYWIITILIFVNALLLVFTGWRLRKGKRWIYFFGLLVLIANILLTFTDELGIADFVYLILALGLLLFLVIARHQYTHDG